MRGGRHGFDVVIVGGGAIGCAVAAFLLDDPGSGPRGRRRARPDVPARVLGPLGELDPPAVLDPREHPHVAVRLPVPARPRERPDPIDVGLEERGYLYLAPPGAATLREVHAVQRAEGAEVVLLDRAELAGRFLDAFRRCRGRIAGAWRRGWFDGFGLLQALRNERWPSAPSSSVMRLSDWIAGPDGSMRSDWFPGGRLAPGTVVNAAGPWARQVAAMAGIELPVEARRRCVFVFDVRESLPGCPLVIDTSGAWFRPEGGRTSAGRRPRPR